MKLPNNHYSNYLISVHFERGFVPDTLQSQIEYCENFLYDLGCLARKNGRRLFATYSICSGLSGLHAHFAVSWLPTIASQTKVAKNGLKRIARYPIEQLLEQSFFFVDNPTQAIKQVTHDKRYVTDYVIYQTKDGQSAIFDGFYIHPDFVPVYSEQKIQSYCSKRQFGAFQKMNQKGCFHKIKLLSLISLLLVIASSGILLALF